MAKETYDRIAADGLPPEAVVLFTASDDKKDDDLMDPEVKAMFDALGAQLTELTERVTALTPKEPTAEELAAAAAAEAEAAALAAAAAEAEAAALAAAAEADEDSEQDTALKAELDAAKARIAELEASSAPNKEETKIDASGIPVGGVAASAIEDAKNAAVRPGLSAFKTPKR
jgi:predicted  nucleic acid-binding Zn-ribbon protein